MQFFIDTAILSEIKTAHDLGVIDGVTTNPSLIAKSGRKLEDVISEICNIVDGPISAEVISTDFEGMKKEGISLSKIHKNVVIKLPLTQDGLKACKFFSEQNIKTNVTLVFSSNQALLAAKCGATYVSPFIGRLDDIGQEGMALIKEIKTIFTNYQFKTKILAASIRHTDHMRACATAGADVATLPLKILQQMYSHPLTTTGLETFLKDYRNTQV